MHPQHRVFRFTNSSSEHIDATFLERIDEDPILVAVAATVFHVLSQYCRRNDGHVSEWSKTVVSKLTDVGSNLAKVLRRTVRWVSRLLDRVNAEIDAITYEFDRLKVPPSTIIYELLKA